MMNRNKSLLIVDDNANLRRLLRSTFKTSQYRLFETDNGKDALAITYQEKPSVVLLDIMLPDEPDGLQICRKIKASAEIKDTCVILLSARNEPVDYEKGKAAGADFYINKPFSPMMLIELVESIAP